MGKVLDLGRKILQGRTRKYTVNIDCTDLKEGCHGQFTFHYPSLMERLQMGVRRSQLLDGIPENSVDLVTMNIAIMLSTLDVVIDQAPDWFNAANLDSDDILILKRVFEEYVDWQNSFRGGDRADDNQEDS